jgi:hypothetical protein
MQIWMIVTIKHTNGCFWREAVIRDTRMSAKCHSRRFYDVLVTSAFPLILMLVKTVSRSEGLLKRLARENHAKGRRKNCQ